MKKLILFLVVLFVTTTVNAGILLIQMDEVEAVGGGSAVNVSDDFSGDLTAWTTESGGWSIVTGALLSTEGAAALISYNTSLSGQSGYALYQLTTQAAARFPGLYFRFTGNTAERAYVVRAEGVTQFVFRTCLGTSCSTIDTWANTPATDDYIGIAWDAGQGNNISIDVWNFGSSAPATPTDPSTWGAADDTLVPGTYFTTNPTHVADGATHTDVGIYSGSTTIVNVDNWYAGDD